MSPLELTDSVEGFVSDSDVCDLYCCICRPQLSCASLNGVCLCLMQLTDGGKAAKAKISVGDVVLSIDGIATERMTHLEAQNKIKACTGNLNLSMRR